MAGGESRPTTTDAGSSPTAGMVVTASARTIGTAATNTSSAPIGTAAMPTRTVIAATTTEAILITVMRRVITMDRHTTDGLTTRGRHRFITTGVGAERRGMAITVPTISRLRCIRLPRFG